MLSPSKSLMLAALLGSVAALTGTACSADHGTDAAEAKASVPVQAAAPAKTLSVNELGGNPASHLGHIVLVGVVGTVNQKKGFLLVDTREYKECGLSCLTEPGTKKIPVRWTGTAPKLKDTVRVDGDLAKSARGYMLTAQRVSKP